VILPIIVYGFAFLFFSVGMLYIIFKPDPIITGVVGLIIGMFLLLYYGNMSDNICDNMFDEREGN